MVLLACYPHLYVTATGVAARASGGAEHVRGQHRVPHARGHLQPARAGADTDALTRSIKPFNKIFSSNQSLFSTIFITTYNFCKFENLDRTHLQLAE